MKEIKFKADGEPLSVKFEFIGFIAATYGFTLWEAKSNVEVIYKKGNNQNPDDDTYDLTKPAEKNHERLIQLTTEFIGLDDATGTDYLIKASVYQGGQHLGSAEENGKITGQTQTSLLFIKLIKQ